MLGEHASIEDTIKKNIQNPLKTNFNQYMKIPFYFPNWFLNKKFVKIFNYIYYLIGKTSSKEKLVNWDNYFYPLDSILEWNKIYGRKRICSISVCHPTT